MANSKTKPKKFSILRVIVVIAVISFIVGIAGIVYIASSVMNALSGDCGTKSKVYKTEVTKAKAFDNVVVLADQPNQTTTIYDSSNGVCNLDVAQAYSATKSFSVNYDGATAEDAVTKSLVSQGFTANPSTYTKDGCSNVSADTSFSRSDLIIRVNYGSPKVECTSNSWTSPIDKTEFNTQKVTAIKATVSTPD